MLVETHLREDSQRAVSRQLRKQGWSVFAEEAFLTGKSEKGNSAGLMVLVARHLRASGPDADLRDAALIGSTQVDCRWMAVQVRLRGVNLLLIEAYFFTGLGCAGPNLALLEALQTVIKLYQGPVLVAADWQFTPSELQASGWLSKVGMTLLHQIGPAHTCAAAHGGGRCIDYFVLSSWAVPLVTRVEVDPRVPWSPHTLQCLAP
jgi:hypothetical protein